MTQVTEHLSYEEVACHDGTPYPPEWRFIRLIPLADAFEYIRRVFGSPIIVDSAYRTEEYNRRIGGARNSQHVQGRALDLRPANGDRKGLHEAVMQARRAGLITGVGHYPTFLHVDTRPGPQVTWYGSRVENQPQAAA